jgi:hypothetical protein
MKSKRCRECGQTKLLDEFYVHVEMGDGHLNKCKVCVKERIRLYRIAQPERVAAIDKIKYEKAKLRSAFRFQRLEYQRAKRTPEINRAHQCTQRRLRVFKPDLCEQCHEREAKHAHHPDYKKPLNVIWLCIRCHQRLHHLPSAEVHI